MSPGSMARGDAWVQDAVLYVLDVRSFYDSDGDGIGDFRGLTQKLDYLAELGVTGLVLLPFYASGGRSGGFDVADHRALDPATGDLRTFRAFVKAAHQRDLRVLADFVVGYTSDHHAWFQEARARGRTSVRRRFYQWRPHDPDGVAPSETEWAWDRHSGAYYRHAGAPHEPALDLSNPRVVKALVSAMAHWLGKGLDGLRLHVPSLLSTTGEALAEVRLPDATWWRNLRTAVSQKHPDAVLLASMDGWPDDLRVPLGGGDACTLGSNPALPLRVIMAMELGDRTPIREIVDQMSSVPPGCRWTLMFGGEKGVSLAALTAEERDFLTRTVGRGARDRAGLTLRRRLAPLLGSDPARVRLALSLLFTLPGVPALFYGDEIQMGGNPYLPGEEGLRTPMQWSSERNGGFSAAEPDRMARPPSRDGEHGYAATNVQVQMANPASLLWWVRRTLALRRQSPPLARGTLEFVPAANRRSLAYVRRADDELALCVASLSRFQEQVELDLSPWHGMRPVEAWSRSRYPVIGTDPWALTLPPYGFAWFHLVGAVTFRSCFLSYSSADEDFAYRLYDDLRAREVRCWMAARDLGAGEHFRRRIAERVRTSERVIVICSGSSFRSPEVALEVRMALEEEHRRADAGGDGGDATVLLPIRIDDAFQRTEEAWFRELRDTRHVGDFEDWREPEAYAQALRRLMRELARPGRAGEARSDSQVADPLDDPGPAGPAPR